MSDEQIRLNSGLRRARLALLCFATACATPTTTNQPVTLERAATLLTAMGFTPQQADGRLSFPHDGPGGGYEVVVRVLDAPAQIRFSTNGLFALADAPDDRGTALLVTQVATLNHDLASGRLSLDPASGEVVYTVEVPAEEGVGDLTLQEAVGRLIGGADAIYPRLAGATRGGPL